MHCFMDPQVWQGIGEVFLGHGKYIVEILKKFQNLDCKPFITPMVMHLKLNVELDLAFVDPFMYRELIDSL